MVEVVYKTLKYKKNTQDINKHDLKRQKCVNNLKKTMDYSINIK